MLDKTLGGRYHIIRHLGGGGFGQTYLASDWHLPGKPSCVVKQLKPKVTTPSALQTARNLFDKEAQALYALGNHDQIPRLFAHFEENKEFFLVQEFVEGNLLSQELRTKKRLTEAEVIDVLQDVLSILEFVHQQQVIHRDIKPSNLIRRQADGRLVLIDFGAVKQIGIQSQESEGPSTLTIVIGSSGYMPNEQMAGKPRFSSDIYALGILGICALTGLDVKHLREDVRTSELIWRDRVQVSPALGEILDMMVRYDHRQRYQSATEALQALRTLAEPSWALQEPTTATGQHSAQFVRSDAHLVWLERGDELFQAQRYQDALACYDKVVQLQPDGYLAWFKQGIVLETLQNYEFALTCYDKVVQLQPEDYLAWFKRGNVLAALQRYEDAIASYDQVLKLQPDNYWVWHDRGQVLEQLQQSDAAMASYERAVHLKPDFQLAIAGRQRMLVQLRQVNALYQLEHYQEVVECCDRVIAEQPQDYQAWFMRGMALENLQRYEDAILSYDRVAQIQPDDYLAWFKRSKALERLQRYSEAAESYGKVVQIHPTHYWAWHDRGQLLEQLQQYEDALAAYDRASQIKPDLHSAVEGRQRILDLLKQGSSFFTIVTTADAHQHGQTAVVKQDDVYWLQQGCALEKLQRYEEAIAAYDRALHLNPENAEVWRCRGKLAFQLGDYTAALNAYDRVLQLYPQDANTWHWRGGTLARLKRYQEAFDCFEQALQIQPESYEFWFWRGQALAGLRKFAEAIASYERAIALNAEYQPALEARQTMLNRLVKRQTNQVTSSKHQP